jgi:glucose/mannose transport system substrate-binding protein
MIVKLTTKLLTATAIVAATSASAGDLEVMHWWTSGGESTMAAKQKS